MCENGACLLGNFTRTIINSKINSATSPILQFQCYRLFNVMSEPSDLPLNKISTIGSIRKNTIHTIMGAPGAYITINGYPLKTTKLRYRRWRFKREDRTIRFSDSSEYLYITRASTLRKRLAEAGYDRTALELEYLRSLQHIYASQDVASYFDVRCVAGRYTPAERAEACRRASLDDWLLALKENITNYHERFTEPPVIVDVPGRPAEVNVLIDTLACNRTSVFPIETEHLQNAFPCASLDCMAVAMLEVVPDSAECILDVTALVDYELVYSFDDLRPEKSGDDKTYET